MMRPASAARAGENRRRQEARSASAAGWTTCGSHPDTGAVRPCAGPSRAQCAWQSARMQSSAALRSDRNAGPDGVAASRAELLRRQRGPSAMQHLPAGPSSPPGLGTHSRDAHSAVCAPANGCKIVPCMPRQPVSMRALQLALHASTADRSRPLPRNGQQPLRTRACEQRIIVAVPEPQHEEATAASAAPDQAQVPGASSAGAAAEELLKQTAAPDQAETHAATFRRARRGRISAGDSDATSAAPLLLQRRRCRRS